MKADTGKRLRRKAYRRGHRAEWIAAAWLTTRAYRIVARRYRTPAGEIDLICRRGDLVAMVEVKARPSVSEAVDAVGWDNRRRINNAADIWLSRQPDAARLSIRFDIVAVCPWRLPVHLQDVF